MEEGPIMADKISWMTRWIVAAVFGSTSWVSPGWSEESVERVERDTTVYWVKTGDTVSDIAKRFLGDAANAPELLKYNNVSNPLEVTEGTLLAIPGRERNRALKLFDEARNALGTGHRSQERDIRRRCIRQGHAFPSRRRTSLE